MNQAISENSSSAIELASIDFEPCDRGAYPIVDMKNFTAGMVRMAKIGHSAHLMAYFTKDELVQTLGKFGEGEMLILIEDLQEAHETLSELCSTIQTVQDRLIVAAACLEVAPVVQGKTNET